MANIPHYDLPDDLAAEFDYAEVSQGSETYGFGAALRILLRANLSANLQS